MIRLYILDDTEVAEPTPTNDKNLNWDILDGQFWETQRPRRHAFQIAKSLNLRCSEYWWTILIDQYISLEALANSLRRESRGN